MDRTTTDSAVTAAVRAARNRAEAERLARRAFRTTKRHRRIVAATGIDIDDLSEHGRHILDWLAGWDEPTIGGVVELVTATRAAAEDARRSVGVDHRCLARSSSDASAPDGQPSSSRP
jgi:hypothetical protein